MRTTVLVPLHASARWLAVVSANLERLATHAHLVVSDATGVDDTLDRLRERFPDHGIEWIGPRRLQPGWVSHCNDLLDRATTELVMWLPHDDEVGDDWVRLAEQALDARPGAVLALGRVRSIDRDADGTEQRGPTSRILLDPHPPFLLEDPVERATAAVAVCLRGNQSWLGAAFRGVFRRERCVPLPETDDRGSWADILWATSMLTLGPFTTVEADYRKRWHDDNTHGSWSDPRQHHTFRSEVLLQSLAGLSADQRSVVLARSWADEVDHLSSGHRATVTRLRRNLRVERARSARHRQDISASTSWRMTAPLRAAGRALRRGRPRRRAD